MTPNQTLTEKPVSVMLYGPSSSTKTSQLYFMAKWLWETKGLKSRLISSDPGGYAPFIDSGFIEQGITEVFDFTSRDVVLADIRRLSKGYWPRYTQNPNSGRVEEYFKTDNNCLTTPEEFSKIGAYFIDSMHHTAEVLKSHCVQRPGNTVGFKEAWSYEEDGEEIRGSQMGHYGIVQDEMMRLHRTGFGNLPVKFLVWTSLVGKGEDKQLSKEIQYGPQLVGNAFTPYVPSWFMHCLHLDTAILPKTKRENGNLEIVEGETVSSKVAWFTEHLDSNTGIKYLCKARVLPERVPDLLKVYPFGCVPLSFTQGIEHYFRVLEALRKKYEIKKENN